MRLGLIAMCVFFIACVAWVEHIEPNRKELVRLEIKKTELEIEKLEFEVSFYREQNTIAVSAE